MYSRRNINHNMSQLSFSLPSGVVRRLAADPSEGGAQL